MHAYAQAGDHTHTHSPTLTILEGQELKDAVQDGHNDGHRQQVGTGLQEGHLSAWNKEPHYNTLMKPKPNRLQHLWDPHA